MSRSARRIVDRALALIADGVDADEALARACSDVCAAAGARSLARSILLAIVTRPAPTADNSEVCDG